MRMATAQDVITVLLPADTSTEEGQEILELLGGLPDFDDRLEIEILNGLPAINVPAKREHRLPVVNVLDRIFPMETYPRSYALFIRPQHLEEEPVLIDPGMISLFQAMEKQTRLGFPLRAMISISAPET